MSSQETSFLQRRSVKALTGIAAALALASCSNNAGHEEPVRLKPATVRDYNCDTPSLTGWTNIPPTMHLKTAEIAARLGVSVQMIEAGVFGPASCNAIVPLAAVQAGDTATVSISGAEPNDDCVLFGTQEDPRTIPKGTKDIFAICATVKTG